MVTDLGVLLLSRQLSRPSVPMTTAPCGYVAVLPLGTPLAWHRRGYIQLLWMEATWLDHSDLWGQGKPLQA